MARFGFHASHEQFPPSALLEYVQAAERAGFTCAMCSDHITPWSERQQESGFAWSWLGAAMQATRLPFGIVNAPGQRYHPAIIAQAAATLNEMFPERFWIAVGSGQLMNEHITGEPWPPKSERNARLRECVDLMRALWAGETVTHDGLVQVQEARLYSLPQVPPVIVGAAVTPQTAEWVGGWADALITISRPREELRGMVDAFRRGGGEGKPMYLQAKHCYAPNEEEAVRSAWEQWRTNIFASQVLTDLKLPSQFDAMAEFIRPEDLRGPVRISADVEQHVDWLRGDVELGFDHIYLHQVGTEQQRFIEVFGEQVLPALADA